VIDLFKEHPYLPFQDTNKKFIDDFFDYKKYEKYFKDFKECFDNINRDVSKLFFEDYNYIGEKFELIDPRRFFFNLYIKTLILQEIEKKYVNEQIILKANKQELDLIDLGKTLIPKRFANHYCCLAKEIGEPYRVSEANDFQILYEPDQKADLLIQKIFLYNFKYLFSRFFKFFINSKKKILQYSENEIVRETNSYLTYQGVGIINIKKEVDEIYYLKSLNKSDDTVQKIFNILKKHLSVVFSEVDLKYFDSYCKLTSEIIGHHIIHLNLVKYRLRGRIKDFKENHNTKIFFSNGLFSGTGIALCDALLYNKFDIYTAEHGLKFSKDSTLSLISDESRTSTHIFNFNKNTQNLFLSKVNKGFTTKIVGEALATKKIRFPYFQRKLNRFIYKSQKPQIIYVSHSIELNSEKYFPYTKTNSCIVKDEISLINVLGSINKNVIIKLYPTKQYLFDKKIFIKNLIKGFKNLRILEKETDFRYMRTAADIIITQSSESTLGWCIGVNKPLVFLDSKYYEPLKDNNTIEVFKKCFFFFNYDKKGWEQDLIKFLNRPYENILSDWEEKQKYRNQYDEEYFLCKEKEAGKIASKTILSSI